MQANEQYFDSAENARSRLQLQYWYCYILEHAETDKRMESY